MSPGQDKAPLCKVMNARFGDPATSTRMRIFLARECKASFRKLRLAKRHSMIAIERVQRAWLILLYAVIAMSPARAQLTLADVQQVIAQAASRAQTISPNSVVAVTDREGYVLAVWSVSGATSITSALTDLIANAIARAGTAAFLSSDQHAFTTRTAGFIVQQNFPPGVKNRGPGPLVGVNFSNLPFSDVNRLKDPAGYNPALTNGINGGPVPTPITGGLAGVPGGVPLYKAGHLVGGIGVAGDGHSAIDINPAIIANADIDEAVALAGQI